VGLLVHLIARGREYLNPGGFVLTNYSSLGADIVKDAISAAGVQASILDQMEVPLKVFNVLNNPVWMKYLQERGRLKPDLKDGYLYWHTISITQVR
jgi:hypothetical protein